MSAGAVTLFFSTAVALLLKICKFMPRARLDNIMDNSVKST